MAGRSQCKQLVSCRSTMSMQTSNGVQRLIVATGLSAKEGANVYDARSVDGLIVRPRYACCIPRASMIVEMLTLTAFANA
jgi:hypothetical protein